MTTLILATDDIGCDRLRRAGKADVVIGLRHRFVWRKLPSPSELAGSLEARSAKHGVLGSHWLDDHRPKRLEPFSKDLGLIELCARCDSIELWVDPRPNDQLILIWLLDVLRPYRDILSRLSIVQTDAETGNFLPESLAEWQLPKLPVTDDRLRLASRAWRAYRAPTPEPCFALLMEDLAAIPRLRAALIALLEEIPGSRTGLGATEYRILDLVSDGCEKPTGLASETYRRCPVFNLREIESLLDGLAYCLTPALSGFNSELEAPDDVKARYERHLWSRLSLTDFGEEVLEHELNFRRHNPISRWWGGTELINSRLWQWDTDRRCLIAP
ncbi:hypothetical protein CI1B_28370 [Bradyrhizobium ivorense]|uniref:DUF1835 domain-containing protein n=1 Tax=Bradyrhizobium ivorense TaxID=2511166 RepID=A0A508T5M4_9BRAD|nr:hypothetical protein [Bradyrhizobium ivorense]VIO69630.1 hypothetical protein CI1B_28370 [Bradyrhizobium ivorense]